MFNYFYNYLQQSTPSIQRIFMPVPLYELTQDNLNSQKCSYAIGLFKLEKNDHETFEKQLDLEYFAKIITKISSSGFIQVGETEKEAKAIVNQHSHNTPILIIELNIPRNKLTEKLSEKDVATKMLNAKGNKYYMLKNNTDVSDKDIVSIKPMTFGQYQNSIRFNTNIINQLWPKDYCFQASEKPNASPRMTK